MSHVFVPRKTPPVLIKLIYKLVLSIYTLCYDFIYINIINIFHYNSKFIYIYLYILLFYYYFAINYSYDCHPPNFKRSDLAPCTAYHSSSKERAAGQEWQNTENLW